ncbi:hypothetical protein PoB_006756600 [Plakobranchus ocellatus]|uniref:DUF19 domain-containing protein n=1 Tax=Plakobranchus ocellatus TaxID=259542 RepID=A0AAV4DAH8_9GAST|nr:hypothetical protein PoB_006756600 [Plakobranchus ocellatus]
MNAENERLGYRAKELIELNSYDFSRTSSLNCKVKGDCSELLACENIFSDIDVILGDQVLVSMNDKAEALDHRCMTLSSINSCITSRLDTCDNDTVKSNVRLLKDIDEYICSAEGRQVALRIASSDCAPSPLVQSQIRAILHGCFETFMIDLELEAQKAEFETSDVCPLADQAKTCAIQGATDMCDEDMGTVVANIWDMAVGNQFAQFCNQNVIQSRECTGHP